MEHMKEERAIQMFLDEVRATVDCTLEEGLDESECYYIAQELLAPKWDRVERITGFLFDRLEEHCGGVTPEYYGMFKSLEDGCTPLAVFREVVKFDYDPKSKKLKEVKVYYELVERRF